MAVYVCPVCHGCTTGPVVEGSVAAIICSGPGRHLVVEKKEV